MDRKKFLRTSIPFFATAGLLKATSPLAHQATRLPPYLKKGNTIGITCPSGFITTKEVQPCVKKMREWGFKVILGKTVGLRDNTFAGTDEERAADLQMMLDADYIDAIMLGRGGYGAVRMIDKIDFTAFRKKPKWVIGFSDATVLHLQLNCALEVASVHSKMCNSFPKDEANLVPGQGEAIDSIRRTLSGETMNYQSPTSQINRAGECVGKLVGGNLSVIQMLCGSRSSIKTDSQILFIEDVGEYLYRLDGMLWNLKRSGRLDNLAGLIIGSFIIKADDPGEEFGLSLHDSIMEKVKEYNYPVCFDFPVGHVYVNYALKCGAMHHLKVTDHNATLTSLE